MSKRDGEDSYTKLSCSVPISGFSGNLFINLRGDRADLRDGNNNYDPPYNKKKAAYNIIDSLPVHIPLSSSQLLRENHTVTLH